MIGAAFAVSTKPTSENTAAQWRHGAGITIEMIAHCR
jgi:hypothetical protein